MQMHCKHWCLLLYSMAEIAAYPPEICVSGRLRRMMRSVNILMFSWPRLMSEKLPLVFITSTKCRYVLFKYCTFYHVYISSFKSCKWRNWKNASMHLNIVMERILLFLPQVVHQKGKDLYILFTRWGRIGDTGMYQQTPFPNKAEAVKEFKKIFRAKSANHWKDVKKWVNHKNFIAWIKYDGANVTMLQCYNVTNVTGM